MHNKPVKCPWKQCLCEHITRSSPDPVGCWVPATPKALCVQVSSPCCAWHQRHCSALRAARDPERAPGQCNGSFSISPAGNLPFSFLFAVSTPSLSMHASSSFPACSFWFFIPDFFSLLFTYLIYLPQDVSIFPVTQLCQAFFCCFYPLLFCNFLLSLLQLLPIFPFLPLARNPFSLSNGTHFLYYMFSFSSFLSLLFI